MVRENKIDRRVKEMRREDPSLKLSVARRLAQAEQDARVDEQTVPRLDAALGITGPVSSWAPRATWAANARDAVVRIPLGPERDHGEAAAGAVVDVAIGDPRHGGDGSGVLVGRAGSGKSYLMRELVLATAAKYGPDRIAFALVNFADGATFQDLDALPHTVMNIVNAQESAGAVVRLRETIIGERSWRRQLLADWRVDTVVEYRAKRGEDLDRRGGKSAMPALPDLVLVADGIDSSVRGYEEYLEMFAAIGNSGADVGVYLLLSAQSFHGQPVLDVMENIGFGIAMRVHNPADSRLVLKTDAAVRLAGAGYEPGDAIIRKASPDRGDYWTRFRAFAIYGGADGADSGSGPTLEAIGQRIMDTANSHADVIVQHLKSLPVPTHAELVEQAQAAVEQAEQALAAAWTAHASEVIANLPDRVDDALRESARRDADTALGLGRERIAELRAQLRQVALDIVAEHQARGITPIDPGTALDRQHVLSDEDAGQLQAILRAADLRQWYIYPFSVEDYSGSGERRLREAFSEVERARLDLSSVKRAANEAAVDDLWA